jgi:hypothetical protein
MKTNKSYLWALALIACAFLQNTNLDARGSGGHGGGGHGSYGHGGHGNYGRGGRGYGAGVGIGLGVGTGIALSGADYSENGVYDNYDNNEQIIVEE